MVYIENGISLYDVIRKHEKTLVCIFKKDSFSMIWEAELKRKLLFDDIELVIYHVNKVSSEAVYPIIQYFYKNDLMFNLFGFQRIDVIKKRICQKRPYSFVLDN